MVYAVILGILFGVGCLGCAGIAIWGAVDEGTVRKCVGGILSPILFILFLCIPFSFHQIESGTVAVVKHMGSVEEGKVYADAGVKFDFWMTNSYECYDTKVQTLEVLAPTYSKDNQPMDVSLTLQWHVKAAEVKEIAIEYGNLDMLASKITSVVSASAKEVLGQTEAETLISTRAKVNENIFNKIDSELQSKYHSEVNTLLLTNIDFSDEFEAAVEAKMKAQQEKLQAQYENEKKKEQAETQLYVAEQEAKALVAKAQAEADSNIAIATAEAKSIMLKSVEVARMLGYKVNEDTVGEGESAVTTYTIVYDETHTGSDIADYLKYIEYMSKWNGELPDVVAGNNGFMITVPTKPDNSNG